MNKKTEKQEVKQKELIKEVKQEVKTKEIENNLEDIVASADDVVVKHKTIIALVAQCLTKHNKLHDEVLAQKLYDYFENNLK